jgi:hypothetical protein
VVAVSDPSQIEKIKEQTTDVGGLQKKLKYWDYKEVLQTYEALELVNESINSLGLVPQGLRNVSDQYSLQEKEPELRRLG